MGLWLVGCVSATSPTTGETYENPSPLVTFTVETSALPSHGTVRGIFCGLTMTGPNGESPCSGADIDALNLAADAEKCGVAAQILSNSECTWANIRATAFRMADGLGRGDMFVFGLSGHGGQMKDDNGDEADGMDEALILYTTHDGVAYDAIRDDRVMEELLLPLWRQCPGLDVMLITDTCHSEGNFKAMARWLRLAQPVELPLIGKEDVGQAVDGGLVQISGCRESQYSYGSAAGGTLTQALLAVRRGDIGRHDVYVKLLPLIDTDQQPQWVEFGTVSARLRNGEFWK